MIGYVGLGAMGGALAERLQSSFSLTVHDMNENAVQRLVAAGAKASGGLPALARQCGIIMLCLPGPDHVRQVLFGEGGIADACAPGTLIIDQTTGDPHSSREFAEELAGRSIHYADAPVSGGARRALDGSITIMLGCRDDDLDQANAILGRISPVIFHMGSVGTGQATKLANNQLLYTQVVASLEALALAAKNGVDPKKAVEVIKCGTGRNHFMERSAERILSGDLWSNAVLDIVCKDLKLSSRLGSMSDVPLPVTNAAFDVYLSAVEDMGGRAQFYEVALAIDRASGTAMVPEGYKTTAT